jgi:3-oxoadipate enol-lactonase
MIYHQFFCDPEKEHTTVVLLHAFPLNSRMWEPQFQQLREQRIPYLAFDYPGFGQSMAWNKSPTMSDYAEVAYFAIKKLNLPKVVVVGLSMGGYVALSLYQKYPDIFHGLVLANTRAVADSEEGKKKRFKLVEEIRNDPSMNGLIQMHLENSFGMIAAQPNLSCRYWRSR